MVVVQRDWGIGFGHSSNFIITFLLVEIYFALVMIQFVFSYKKYFSSICNAIIPIFFHGGDMSRLEKKYTVEALSTSVRNTRSDRKQN